MGNATNLLIKIAFIVSIVIHVLLWPTIAHIVFASSLAIEGLIAYMLTSREEVWATIFSPSLFFFHNEKSQRSYIPLFLIFFYMLFTFLWFANDEIYIQPRMTTWIDNSLVYNYSFNQVSNTPFSGVSVTSDVAKRMRDNAFEWPRTISSDAVRLTGLIQQANVQKTTLNCLAPIMSAAAALSSNITLPTFSCHAARLFHSAPPDTIDPAHSILPAPSQFYTAKVTITPPFGIPCASLEAYRIVLDPEGNVVSGLDYPASSILHEPSNVVAPYYCGLFGVSAWCLHFQHTFTNVDYVARVATKCATDGGVLKFELPSRAIDVDPSSGKVGLDALIVTYGAKVRVQFDWQEPVAETSSSFVSSFQKPWVNPSGDAMSEWRKSSTMPAVFFKYLFLITPLLFAWYYLGINFMTVVVESQILLLCTFVLFPSILIFLSMGAWLPMAGSIICVIAINHTPETDAMRSWWRSMVRPSLFFITAACNSIQFAWLLTLVGQAGWNAFLYEGSLKQLAELSSKFIISDSTSPTWIALMLPSLLLVNLAFLLGSAICIVLEMLPRIAKSYYGTATTAA